MAKWLYSTTGSTNQEIYLRPKLVAQHFISRVCSQWICKIEQKSGEFYKNFKSQDSLPRCNWLLSETTWCSCLENELFVSSSPRLVSMKGLSMQCVFVWNACGQLARALQGMITSQGEQLSNSVERLLIFSLSPPPSLICCMLSLSPPILHMCGTSWKPCVRAQHTQRQTSKHKDKER